MARSPLRFNLDWRESFIFLGSHGGQVAHPMIQAGKRTQEQTKALVQDAKSRLRPGHLPAIFTDAYVGYESALLEVFGRRYAQPHHGSPGRAGRPVVRWPQGLAYGQVHKIYKGSRVERVEVRAVHGKAHLKHVLPLLGYKVINTSVVERHNRT